MSDLLNYTGYLLQEVEKNLNLTLILGIMLQLKYNILQKKSVKKYLSMDRKKARSHF